MMVSRKREVYRPCGVPVVQGFAKPMPDGDLANRHPAFRYVSEARSCVLALRKRACFLFVNAP